MWWSWRAVAAVGLVAAAIGAAGCRDEGDVRVASVSFDGNRAFSAGQLKTVVATRAGGGWLPWSRKRYFTRNVFDADLERLKMFYADRGYPSLRVTGVAIDFNDDKTAVRLRISLDEGAPIIVEQIAFAGLETAPEEVTERLASLPLKAGRPRDRQHVAASRERLTFLLRDHGFAQAAVVSREVPGSAADRVVVTFEATPGAPSTFGAVAIKELSAVRPSLVLRTLTFRPGDPYRESKVTESQARLAALGIFDFAHLGPTERGGSAGEPGVVPMLATLTEGKPQRYQIGVGYGTEDGPRGSFQWDHLNFAGDGRRMALDSRYSFRLRGAGLEFIEPYFLSNRLSLNARVGAWWTSESTYTSRTIGARFGITFRRMIRGNDLERVEHTWRGGYINESLDYAITPEALADQSQFDELIALGLDPITGSGQGRLAALEFDVERASTDHPFDPRRGHRESLHLLYATPSLGGTFKYNEVLIQEIAYAPLPWRMVLAGRARAGAVFAASADQMPFSQRYFLGGSSSLRGWGRFQVAPLTTDGLPIGGRAVVELTAEVRAPVRGNMGAVFFVDAGNVWDESTTVRLRDLRVDIGPGLRYRSPVGIIRADFGVQLRRVEGLAIDGEPEKRSWRVHFSIGHTF